MLVQVKVVAGTINISWAALGPSLVSISFISYRAINLSDKYYVRLLFRFYIDV